MSTTKLSDSMEDPSRVLERLMAWRWWIIILFSVFIFFLEIIEHPGTFLHIDAIHIAEFFLFGMLLIVIGMLLEMLSRSITAKTRAVYILELKHKLSLELTLARNWDELTNLIMQALAAVVEPSCAMLLVYNQHAENFEIAAEWRPAEGASPDCPFSDPSALCELCVLKSPFKLHPLQTCKLADRAVSSDELRNGYCMPLAYRNSPIALIRFELPKDKKLTEDQMDTLNNIGFEMAVALVTAQHQVESTETQTAEATLAERRNISRDLHDTLGQNLSYLRLKLDQLSRETHSGQLEGIRPDLVRMREVADESVELVRGMLVITNPDTQPHLEGLLREHGIQVAERANFNINIRHEGQPRPVLSHYQRQILYIFREALNNVEKHAGASQVEVVLSWCEKSLAITVSDNGRGFDPASIDLVKHFGLAIMKERVEMLQGELAVETSPNMGTQISIRLPV